MGFFDFLRRKRPEDSGSGSGTNDPTTATAAPDETIGEAGLSEPPGPDAQPDAPDSGGIGEAGLSEPPGPDAQPDAPDSGSGDSGTS